MNLNKKILSVLLILLLLVVAWVVVLQLTKQRIQLEAQNKIMALMTAQSPFAWSFENSNIDIVTPYQKYWKSQEDSDTIYAEQGSNPKLSLNFSGEKVNTQHYQELQLYSPTKLHGTLKLQIKVSHEDGIFYYSKSIKLSGNEQTINLEQEWSGLDDSNNKVGNFKWRGNKNQISSLILQFTNPKDDLHLDFVKLLTPLRTSGIKKTIDIDCKGIYDSNIQPEAINYNLFILNESCWLPSNYMWLKGFVSNNFPGSIFIINDADILVENTVHKVNTNYSRIIPINIIFYTLIVLLITTMYFLTNRYKQTVQVFKQKKIYSWRHAYTVVLGVSFLLLMLMSWFELPDKSIFKLLPMYFLWAIFQQFILGYVLAEKFFLKRTQNKFLSSFFAATVFSLFHLPSTTLVIVTLIAGFFWSYAWLTYKRIIPLAISHTLLALMFYFVISERILYSARVFHWFWE